MCGTLRASDAGKKAVLMGWVNKRRDHGSLLFLDLRDRTGVTQVVVNADGDSTKMRELIKDVNQDLWTTKSIIFSCWTRTLDLLSKHLQQAKIPYLRIDGDCPLSQRQAKLGQFAVDDEKPVLIMTTGTGGFGLNLTCANRVFIVELQWNPGVESQAIARAIRLGQENEVLVTRYVIKDTVEEEMRSQQQWKKQIAALGFEEIPDVIGDENRNT